VNICREDLDSPIVMALVEALDTELLERYPEPGAHHFELEAEEIEDGLGAFLVGYVDGRPVACGAIRSLGGGAAEIKRMYVRPDVRGQGLAWAVLLELERIALELGARRLVLEAGARQAEALALYRRAGFAQIERFGRYASSPLSICMAKDLR